VPDHHPVTPPQNQPPRQRPASADEEILGAETSAVLSLLDDEARIRSVSEELRAGFGALAHVGKAVTFFGSARTQPSHPEYEQARELAQRLGEAGFAIITGGGPGTMEAANRGARDAGVQSIGLAIELPHEEGLNRFVDLPLQFHYFFTRKVMFVRYASAFVCLPGGFGTLDELFEVLTLRQTEKIQAFPVVLVGTDYWCGLIDWLRDRLCAEGKIGEADVREIVVTDDFDEVLSVVEAAEHRRPRINAAPTPRPGGPA
jgi:uncharacterized protein (TIGR00730 family)